MLSRWSGVAVGGVCAGVASVGVSAVAGAVNAVVWAPAAARLMVAAGQPAVGCPEESGQRVPVGFAGHGDHPQCAYSDRRSPLHLASCRKVRVVAAATLSVGNVHQDIEETRVGDPGRDAQAIEHLAVELDRELSRLVVAHALDAKSGAELTHRNRQPLEVLLRRSWNAVEIVGRTCRSVSLACDSADDEILDAVAMERFEDAYRVERGASAFTRRVRHAGRGRG